MSIRRIVLFVGSVVLAALLVLLLVRIGKVNLHHLASELRHTSLAGFTLLLLLNALLVLLSTVKWRIVDATLRHPTDAVPSVMAAYSITSLGMALGLLLPVQLGMTTARTLGIYAYGKTLKRGTGGTVYEQAFDFLVVILLSAASIVIWLTHGDAWTWGIGAVVIVAAALVSVKPFLSTLRRLLSAESEEALLRLIPYTRMGFIGRFRKRVFGIRQSALAEPSLVRRLFILSIARFAILVSMSELIAVMTNADISTWRIAAAIPFATISNVIAVTPGGVGVNEFASVTALHLLGSPLTVAVQWALANRVLATASSLIVAVFAILIFGVQRILNPYQSLGKSVRGPVQIETKNEDKK